jgi:hypothetical protein
LTGKRQRHVVQKVLPRHLFKKHRAKGNMSEALQSTATILKFPKRNVPPVRFVPLAKTIELYASLYPTPSQLLLVVESWGFAARREGIAERNPQYMAALKRARSAVRSSKTVAEAITLLRSQEAALSRS